MIKNTLQVKLGNPESLKKYYHSSKAFQLYLAKICRGFSTGFLFTVLWFNWSLKKLCLAKVLLTLWKIPLHEDNRNYNSQRFSYKFAFILFFSFLTNQKQESGFQQEIFLLFVYIESRSTLKPCWIQ